MHSRAPAATRLPPARFDLVRASAKIGKRNTLLCLSFWPRRSQSGDIEVSFHLSLGGMNDHTMFATLADCGIQKATPSRSAVRGMPRGHSYTKRAIFREHYGKHDPPKRYLIDPAEQDHVQHRPAGIREPIESGASFAICPNTRCT
jgi:hypothetical protein